MKVELLSIGDELLGAEILDTNASYLTRCLRQLGLTLTARVIVGDRRALIADAFGVGLERADVVISSGGLGRNNDDFTRQAVAELTGREVTRTSPGVSGSVGLGSPPSAQGLVLETKKGTLICLPGSQREMAHLMQTEVLPYLEHRLPGGQATGWVLLRTAGLMESNVREMLAGVRLQPGEQITYASYAGQTDIRVLIKAKTEMAVTAGLARLTTEIEARLGDHIYGRDRQRLEQVTLEKLRKHRLRVAVAEHDTGEAVAQMMHPFPDAERTLTFLPLVSQEGISRYLQIRPLREEGDPERWCRVAADSLRQQMEVDLGLVVFKNATAGGVQLMTTLAGANDVSLNQRSFGGHPENINHWAGTMGVVHLRRWLLANYPD